MIFRTNCRRQRWCLPGGVYLAGKLTITPRNVLLRAWRSASGRLSTTVCSEIYPAVGRKGYSRQLLGHSFNRPVWMPAWTAVSSRISRFMFSITWSLFSGSSVNPRNGSEHELGLRQGPDPKERLRPCQPPSDICSLKTRANRSREHYTPSLVGAGM